MTDEQWGIGVQAQRAEDSEDRWTQVYARKGQACAGCLGRFHRGQVVWLDRQQTVRYHLPCGSRIRKQADKQGIWSG